MPAPFTQITRAVFVTLENTGFDTHEAPSATDAVAVLDDFSLEPSQNWERRLEAVQSASSQGEIEGLRGGSWTLPHYIKPNSTPANAPDFGDLLVAAGFTATNPSSDTLYSLNSSAPSSLQIMDIIAETQQIANGAFVKNVQIKQSGNSPGIITFSGGYASHGGVLGEPVIASGSGTSITMNSSHPYKVLPGALVAFDTEDNSGAGYLVSAVSSDGLTLTITPTLAGAVSAADQVLPITLSSTTAGTPQGGIACGLSIGGTDLAAIDFECNIDTGILPLEDEFSSDRATGIALGDRTISGKMKFYFKDANAEYLARTWNGTQAAVVFRAGPDTSGSRMKVTMPACQLKVAPLNTPRNEVATWEADFMAHQSSTANDEITIHFD